MNSHLLQCARKRPESSSVTLKYRFYVTRVMAANLNNNFGMKILRSLAKLLIGIISPDL